jgi:glyoxylase-like metal-dependent hydrolase (beta-lactamase superfamily II)
MRKNVIAIAVLAALSVVTMRAQDARTTIDAMANALGMLRGLNADDAVLTAWYEGTGMSYAPGQSWRPDMPWPAAKVTRYRASIGYYPDQAGMRVEIERTNPDGLVQGGGGLPFLAPRQQIQVVAGRFGWNETQPGMNATPALGAARDRALALWMLPHSVVKAAYLAGADARVTMDGGATVLTVPVPGMTGTTMTATLDAENLIERVEAMVDDPVLGDTVVEVTYAGYGELGGALLLPTDILFPARIMRSQGGHPILDLTIQDVNAYNPYIIFPVPETVEQAAAMPSQVRVETQEVADGVWYLTGGSHHSVAVEFDDHVVVVEGPLNDARALAVIDAVKTAIPNKPIRYVVNTHHHVDHAGGLRAFVADGATVITQAQAADYFAQAWANPHTLNPDRLAQAPREPVIEGVDERRVLTDGTRTLELHRLQDSNHADTMLVAYLPADNILIEADVYTPAPPNAPPPATPHPESVNLYNNIERLQLDVAQILPIHGRQVTLDDLRAAIGRTGN